MGQARRFDGAVAIKDDQIAAVHREDDIEHDARETVDLDGLALAPGSMNLHSHLDLRLFADPNLSPKTRQGVTTELLEQDGFSMAPMCPEAILRGERITSAVLTGDPNASGRE
jgi:N-acyl-D-amino-acid deacylase